MVKRVAIVNHGLCNMGSVARAISDIGATPVVSDCPTELSDADGFILPGVGAFPDAMRILTQTGLADMLAERVVVRQRPFLGICLGFQLMAAVGFEGGQTAGLGWLDATVERLMPTADSLRVPHVGWNTVEVTNTSYLFRGIPSGKDFYFVHSYHVVCAQVAVATGTTPYCGGFTSVVECDNLFGVQFHPEKSQKFGRVLLKNFLQL